ncbi:MAG: HD domain-containing protein [Burkholderiales bacterium]|nr:HD domain-containing protein [Burkholderiales bacterium]
MAEQILVDRFVREPRWSRIVIPVICLIAAGSMAVLFISGVGATWMTLGSLAIGVTPLLLSIMLFAQGGRFVSAGAPVIVTALLFVTFFAMRFSIERRQSLMWFKRLENARQVTIESMAAVAETRDPETGAHIKRTQYYVKTIAEELRRTGWYTDILTPEYIDLLFISAPLHDIGKVGVPDHILLKPARLTPEEFEIMKRHAEFGREIIFSSARLIEGDNFLILAGEIAATHHEKWDGTGYPAGLAGNDIPLSGRIMAVADIYDALISRRCYKEPFSHDKAVGIIREGRGTTFDPVVIDAFFAVEATVIDIAARYQD